MCVFVEKFSRIHEMAQRLSAMTRRKERISGIGKDRGSFSAADMSKLPQKYQNFAHL
jgi:hypothetical protein